MRFFSSFQRFCIARSRQEAACKCRWGAFFFRTGRLLTPARCTARPAADLAAKTAQLELAQERLDKEKEDLRKEKERWTRRRRTCARRRSVWTRRRRTCARKKERLDKKEHEVSANLNVKKSVAASPTSHVD